MLGDEVRKVGRGQFLRELADLVMRWDVFQVLWETTEGFLAERHELIYTWRKTSLSALRRIECKWARREAGRVGAISVVLAKDIGGLGWEESEGCESRQIVKTHFHLPAFRILLMV